MKAFQEKLLHWFDKNQRPLPWRKHYEPYQVWISEIMLQQTQVETALPYFDRWIRTFPNIESLAKSDEKKVLKLWQGLGYYSRARNLHAGAKLVVEKFSGRFPSDYENILSLKGIGRYTAGAIASIAFNQDKPIVDGNVLRVLSRIYAIKDAIDVEKNKETFWKLQESLIPKGKARHFNQALMELGALVCTSKNPKCLACPIESFCQAYKKNNPEDYPVKSKKKKMIRVEAAALVIEKEGKYFLHKRPLGKIMGGLWEFPEWKLSEDKKLSFDQIKSQTEKALAKDFGIKSNLQGIGTIKRNYTHHLESLHVFKIRIDSTKQTKPQSDWPHAWSTKKDFAKHPFSSAHAKIANLISSPY